MVGSHENPLAVAAAIRCSSQGAHRLRLCGLEWKKLPVNGKAVCENCGAKYKLTGPEYREIRRVPYRHRGGRVEVEAEYARTEQKALDLWAACKPNLWAIANSMTYEQGGQPNPTPFAVWRSAVQKMHSLMQADWHDSTATNRAIRELATVGVMSRRLAPRSGEALGDGYSEAPQFWDDIVVVLDAVQAACIYRLPFLPSMRIRAVCRFHHKTVARIAPGATMRTLF